MMFYNCTYAFLWLNKSRYTSSSVIFSDSYVDYVATGKQEEAHESMHEDIYSMEQNQSFNVESMLKYCDVEREERGLKY